MPNLEARPDIAWIDDSIRPHESIWSVLLRFSALNVIPARVLSKEFFTYTSFADFNIWEAFSVNRINHERFKNALGVEDDQYELLDIGRLKKSNLLELETSIKYCPKCIEHYYHSVYFQLLSLERCPIHHIKLRDKCPNCSRYIEPRIRSRTIKQPFYCSHCRKPLFKEDAKKLLDPNGLVGFEAFDQLDHWCNDAFSISSHYAKIFRAKYERPNLEPFYSQFSKQLAPSFLKFESEYEEYSREEFHCGIKPDIRKMDDGKPYDFESLNSNMISILRSYRRYLLKTQVEKKYRNQLRKDRKKWFTTNFPTMECLRQFAVETLLRRVDQLERNKLKFFYQDQFKGADATYNYFSSASPSFYFCNNHEEVEWVLLHAYMAELHWLYKEALIACESMIKNDKLYQVWPLNGRLTPLSYITRNDSGHLIFTSIQTVDTTHEAIPIDPYEYI